MKRFLRLFLALWLIVFSGISCVQNVNETKPLVVTVEEDGFHLKINHTEKYKDIVIKVYNLTDSIPCVELYPKAETKEVVYPFVEKGKEYEIFGQYYEKDWVWESHIDTEKFHVKSKGGIGDFRIAYSGFCYDGDRLLSLSDYKVIDPGLNMEWKNAFGCIYYTSYPPAYSSFYNWHQNWNGGKEFNEEKGTFKITDEAAATLSEKNHFWFKFVYSFGYKGENYQFPVDSQPVTFEFNKNKLTQSTEDGVLNVDTTGDGLRIYENIDSSFYKNVRIRIWDITNNRNCPGIISNGSDAYFDYPFVEKDCEYCIFLDAWDENWGNFFRSKEIVVKAKGGSGNFIFDFSSAYYDDADKNDTVVSQMILNDFSIINPLWENTGNIYCAGDIYLADRSKKVWNKYPFNNGVINLKDQFGFIRGNQFICNFQYYFTCNEREYEYGFINESDNQIFTDTHELPVLVLNNDYQEIYEYGEYGIGEQNKNKKAFLITYNSAWKSKGDYRNASARNAVEESNLDSDCIIVNLPDGDIVPDNARAAGDDRDRPDYSNYVVGVTTKDFDDHKATLVSAHNHCNIWFYNSNDSTTQTLNKKISGGEFSYKKFGEYFDQYFEMMTYVFGSNIPKVQYSNKITVTENTKIDLFICDMISAGYGTSAGMYWGKNMYTKEAYSKSNACEMLYIGVYAINTWGYGTFNVALHEFQHLLADVNKNGNYDHDYTEMMSCACENIMQTQYPEGIRTYENGMISSRFSNNGFNAGYMVGISNWSQLDGNQNYSYGTNCAFIDFIMRYYGGVEVLRKIAHSSYTNRDAVVNAVNQMGYNETLDSLMMKFAVCTINSGLSEDKAALGITATKYVSTDATVYGRKVKFELMPMYYNWYYSNGSSLYNNNNRYEKVHFNNWENKGPAIIDNSKGGFEYMFPKSFNIKYLGQNLNSATIEKPEDDIILAVVFIE